MDSCRVKTGFHFVLMLGDNIYGGKSPQDEISYESLLATGVKFSACIGNHDDTNERLYKPNCRRVLPGRSVSCIIGCTPTGGITGPILI